MAWPALDEDGVGEGGVMETLLVLVIVLALLAIIPGAFQLVATTIGFLWFALMWCVQFALAFFVVVFLAGLIMAVM